MNVHTFIVHVRMLCLMEGDEWEIQEFEGVSL
jgi:thymidylate synthase ThyX